MSNGADNVVGNGVDSVTIHPTAIVDEGAQIGAGSRVWHWVHVCGGAKIGGGVSLGQNVFVGNKVVIGDKCKVQNNVSVYDNVILEEGVFLWPKHGIHQCLQPPVTHRAQGRISQYPR
jgi:UDP-2-acetamido-3-amino-2,3-dideoxy-glucuronate N-acetyltransferase